MKPFTNILTQILFLSCFLSYLSVHCQNKNGRLGFNEKKAREYLEYTLSDSTQHNVIKRDKALLDTEKKAIAFAEPVLFDLYSAREIKRQRPYSAFKIDNYWLLSGTLPKGYTGGTFIMIVDARDCRVIRITHGK